MLLKDWFESLGMRNVENCIVTLTNTRRKHHEMAGCVYNNPNLGNRVYIYCLGNYVNVPLKSTSKTTVLYRDESQACDFIIASYTDNRCLDEPYKVYHPFGYSVILCPVTRQFVNSCDKISVGEITIK